MILIGLADTETVNIIAIGKKKSTLVRYVKVNFVKILEVNYAKPYGKRRKGIGTAVKRLF